MLLERPFETAVFTGGTVFSHGHFILNAGYSQTFDNIFNWEEPYQTYLAWKAGYKLYAMNQNVIYHLWNRDYRPSFGDDARSFSHKKQQKLGGSSTAEELARNFDSVKQGNQIRRIIYGD